MFKFIILFVFLNIFNQIKSQTEEPKILIMGVPQYLLVEALRIDIDLRMPEKNKWTVVSPIIFLQNNPDGVGINGDFESLRGGGLEVTFKQILSTTSQSEGLSMVTL